MLVPLSANPVLCILPRFDRNIAVHIKPCIERSRTHVQAFECGVVVGPYRLNSVRDWWLLAILGGFGFIVLLETSRVVTSHGSLNAVPYHEYCLYRRVSRNAVAAAARARGNFSSCR